MKKLQAEQQARPPNQPPPMHAHPGMRPLEGRPQIRHLELPPPHLATCRGEGCSEEGRVVVPVLGGLS